MEQIKTEKEDSIHHHHGHHHHSHHHHHHHHGEYEFTIRHFKEDTRGTIKPALGRMNLAQSLNPLKGAEKIFNWIKKVPLMYLPLFAMPNAAMAYGPYLMNNKCPACSSFPCSCQGGAVRAPPGFESFTPVHQMDFVQQLIDINKNGILYFEQQISHLGLHGSSAGLSIIIWAACLKILTSPIYETTLKYPTQMEKAVQDVIEAQLKRDNPD